MEHDYNQKGGILMECQSRHLYTDRMNHQAVTLQCRLKMGHVGFHKAYHGESPILWV